MTRLIRLAAFLGFSGVALGAFGAHGLRGRVPPELLEAYRTGVLYHLLHALALLGVALGARRLRRVGVIAGLFTGGVVLFSGSLYAMALTGITVLGAITPLGGLAFLAGWVMLFFAPCDDAAPPGSPAPSP